MAMEVGFEAFTLTFLLLIPAKEFEKSYYPLLYIKLAETGPKVHLG